MSKKPLLITHKHCADGTGALWCFWQKYEDTYEYFLASYTDVAFPDFSDRDVILVDFSYKREKIAEIISVAKSVKLIDHHKSALADLNGLPGLDFTISTSEHSGAALAWMYLNPGCLPPTAIKLIEDRDLWRFHYPATKPFSQYLFSLEYNIEEWDKVMRYAEDPDTLAFYVSQGEAIERKHLKDIKELMQYQFEMVIGGYRVPVMNVPYTMASDAANMLCQDDHSIRFAATYYDSGHGRHFSLRSWKDNPMAMDVSEIAVMYGGGGHKHASGFTVPHTHELAKKFLGDNYEEAV